MASPSPGFAAEGPRAQGPPQISLPKGGGAIRGIGETFTANPVTGTGALSVPIATPPGRGGFGPSLSLSYDSGAGNGPFGFGWSLSLPAITRKTDKGLPRYNDAADSDVFLLSGAEDLVPVAGAPLDTLREPGYTIRQYRPRTEGLFARIERWTKDSSGEVHWRSISKDNVLTVYGLDDGSRIRDPEDDARVFSWLICQTRDDKGNAVLYRYKEENGVGVDLAQAHQANRGAADADARTANRHLRSVRYGNRVPLLDGAGDRPRWLTQAQVDGAGWMFEVCLDYGEYSPTDPKPAQADTGAWPCRADAFSIYRSGFEVRTNRLCRRILVFHHFPGEQAPGDEPIGTDCLVRSTDLVHESLSGLSFLVSVTQSGHRRLAGGGYRTASMPPLELSYSPAVHGRQVHEVDRASLANLPQGADGAYQWADLHGEGLSGLLVQHGGAWLFKRNRSALPPEPLQPPVARFEAQETLAAAPAGAQLGGGGGGWQLMDVTGEGRAGLVALGPPLPGLFERTEEGWAPFRPFLSLPNLAWGDPRIKFVDLDGDGRADVLVADGESFSWHASLARDGFAPPTIVALPRDDKEGPRVAFADPSQSVVFADLSGDGLSDLVCIRNGEVCYWPNLGHGRFGAKVTMDHPPLFDAPDQFDARRIRLADIDGSGTTDLIYLGRGATRYWFNRSGNSWSDPETLAFPAVDNVAGVAAVDLLGDGTSCLVWSSALPGEAHAAMRYVRLMAAGKPHLLVAVRNNLGAESRIRYAPSTEFYLRDRRDGRPWITTLPFPVQVVERVETIDRVSRNRFTARYAYHHGFYDGHEREFRGFGMVEQWDTAEWSAVGGGGTLIATNANPASDVPPVHTKTWFHTGAWLGRHRISTHYATEYCADPGPLLPDTVLPPNLTLEEEREACRALKGSMLRQEVYADDKTADAGKPYAVTEQTFAVEMLQPRGTRPHAIFHVRPAQSIASACERDPTDPRIAHTLTLEVDAFGNVLKQASVAYGRRRAEALLPADLLPPDRAQQRKTYVTYTESLFTELPPVNPGTSPDDHRLPLPCESAAYELTGHPILDASGLYVAGDFVEPDLANPGRLKRVASTRVEPEDEATGAKEHRLLTLSRTLYRPDDLGVLPANDPLRLLPLRSVGKRAVAGETYRLAFSSGLLGKVYRRRRPDGTLESLLPNPGPLLEERGPGGGGYVAGQALKAAALFPAADPDGLWWAPSGRDFLSPGTADTAAQELAHARTHFFLPHRRRDPFHAAAIPTESSVTYDTHLLALVESRDAAGNRITAGERLPGGEPDPAARGIDYRVLQPFLVTDPNGNRVQAAFDALGMVVGTAVMGKRGAVPADGDTLAGFVPDLDAATVATHLAAPLTNPLAILAGATTRLVYDLHAYARTWGDTQPQPAVVCTLTREAHHAARGGATSRVQPTFSYSDGFGRELQKKACAEPGPVPTRDPNGEIVLDADNRPVMTPHDVQARWVGTGWTVFNNKGKPVRQFEPFFTDRHAFEAGVEVGVSPVLFYDPLDRVVATLRPDGAYQKVLFGPWHQETWDANDTVLLSAKTDPDVARYTKAHFDAIDPAWKTWRERRPGNPLTDAQADAAEKAARHAATPARAHLDALGHTILTVAHNGFGSGPSPPVPLRLSTRSVLDVEGQQLAVRDLATAADPQGRTVVKHAYDLLGRRIHQASMEAGDRWTLEDALGKPIRGWDSRRNDSRTHHDALRRPLRNYTTGADPAAPATEVMVGRHVYGEQHADAEALNLRGTLYLQLDPSGAASTEERDFKGNVLRARRRIASEYKGATSWSGADGRLPAKAADRFIAADLEAEIAARVTTETFEATTTYDALNRPVLQFTPHAGAATMTPYVIWTRYSVANLLEAVDVQLEGETEPNGRRKWTRFVTAILHDAKGQRKRIDYGNETTTTYEHDPLTHRLTRLTTRRDPAAFDDGPKPPENWPGHGVQDLSYAYDPMGNVTSIRDDAQQAVFFHGALVEPSNHYRYDPLYRLVEATGREHLGQVGGAPQPYSCDDAPRVRIEWGANDGNALARYTETYRYDDAGNLKEMHHGTWVRTFAHTTASLLEPGQYSNRLASTDTGGAVATYTHDANGNLDRMPHLRDDAGKPNLHWTPGNQIRQADLKVGGTAYYVYDSAGQRVRKVWEKSAGRVEERLYLGSVEVFRRKDGAGTGAAVKLERETLHVMDDKQRIAMVELRTKDPDLADKAPRRLTRYQFGNHLGSASLELDEDAAVISYEEHSPYGSTTYQAVRKKTETPKRYRFTGKERDFETGLYYHGARHYAPWLGRWTSCDPVAAPNLYVYCRDDPVRFVDPDGKWEVDWGAVGRGAGYALVGVAVGVVVVGAVVATGGLAAGAIAGAVGATATTTATAVAVTEATILVGAAAYGGYGMGTNAAEVYTGRDSETGQPLTDQQRSEQLGAAGVDAVSMGLAGRGVVRARAAAAAEARADRAMVQNLVERRRALQPSSPDDQVRAVTLAEGRTPGGAQSEGRSLPRSRQDPANPTAGHAERQATEGLPREDGTTIAVDQIPCSGAAGCEIYLETTLPPESRVVVPQAPGQPNPVPRSVDPRSSVRPQVVAAAEGQGTVEPRVLLRTPPRITLGRAVRIAAQTPLYGSGMCQPPPDSAASLPSSQPQASLPDPPMCIDYSTMVCR